MRVLSFTVTFHSPFRVGSAYARDGVDAALDRHDPLPPDHLKGLMRSAARDLLGLPPRCIEQVFGSASQPSPWSWSSAAAAEPWKFSHRHRVKIDLPSHTALRDHLMLGEQAWAEQASFEVRQAGAIAPDDMAQQVLILRCTAAAVHGLGGTRRRGLGWVGITPDDGPVSAEEAAHVIGLAASPAIGSGGNGARA